MSSITCFHIFRKVECCMCCVGCGLLRLLRLLCMWCCCCLCGVCVHATCLDDIISLSCRIKSGENLKMTVV